MLASARAHVAAITLVAIAVTGCISAEPGDQGLPPMCSESSDCDQGSGEICDEGVCWGGPPDVQFAAVLVPPLGRGDLPVAVLPRLVIAADGSIGGLDFPESVAIHGRVLLACPDLAEGDVPGYACGDAESVAAQIVIERGPGFEGGPTYSRTVPALAGIGPGQDAFFFLVPRDPDAEYRITIVPADDGEDGA